MDLFSRQLESPIGPLRIAVDLKGRLHRLWFPATATGEVPVVLPASPEAIGATVPYPTAGRALDGIARRRQRAEQRHVAADALRLLGERAPLNRMVTAEEVANAVLFLASDEASGVNAAEIAVDCGTTGAMAGSPRFVRGEPQD